MKKILIFLVAALSVAFFSGCESVEGDYETQRTIKIVSTDVVFERAGGSGTIVVEAEGSIVATSSRPWCTTSVSGNTINVNVGEYDGLDNRYADIIITCGDYSTRVTAHQYGCYFLLPEAEDSYRVEDINGQVAIPLSHNNYEPAGVADVDWLSTVYENGNVIIKAADNKTGQVRTGNITIGDKKIQIIQWSFDTVFAGEYDWSGTTTASGTVKKSMPVTISDYDAEKGTFRINFTNNSMGEGAYMEVPFDPDTFTFTMSAGQYIGETVYKNAPAYIYTMVYGGGYITWDASIKAAFTFTLDPETGKYYAALKDIGTWLEGERVVSGVYFELFKANSPTSANRMKISISTKVYNNVLIQK